MTKFPIKILLENCLDATGDQSSLHQIDIFSNGHFRNGDHSRLQKRFGDYTADGDGAGTQFTLATNFFLSIGIDAFGMKDCSLPLIFLNRK
jgi:hypothetical protein